MTNNNYFKDPIIQFPILKSIIEEDAEMIHMRMESFTDFTMEKIKSDDYVELKRCFNFQESKINSMSSDLRNALVVSYCESLLLGKCADKMSHVINLMPAKLKAIYIEYEKWYKDLTEKGTSN